MFPWKQIMFPWKYDALLFSENNVDNNNVLIASYKQMQQIQVPTG